MKAKKSLGQNFLKSPQVIADIITAAHVHTEDTILEIGPGMGILTEALLHAGAYVVSVEKDDRLIPELTEKFRKYMEEGRLTIIHKDILETDIAELNLGAYKLVANIPYYITGQIIRMFLSHTMQPISMTLLVQKEVADRIVAKDGKESLLSLSVKIYGDPRSIRTVGRGSFIPQPTVDSAVILIDNISKNRLGNIPEGFFFKVLHAAFAHKRKQLMPNLSALFSKEVLSRAFDECGISHTARGEDIPLPTWIALCTALT